MQIPQQIQLSLIQAVGKVQKGVSVIVGMGNKMGGGADATSLASFLLSDTLLYLYIQVFQLPPLLLLVKVAYTFLGV